MERRAKMNIVEGACLIVAGIIILIIWGPNLDLTDIQGPSLYWTFFGVLSLILGLGFIVYTRRTMNIQP
ncbi:MAG: hypothetical protein EAX95_04515 [Candidatus Thorarchaeota archaeon]|nr:hypothetical protein [Candidatus Thorarchaeota archaeon]